MKRVHRHFEGVRTSGPFFLVGVFSPSQNGGVEVGDGGAEAGEYRVGIGQFEGRELLDHFFWSRCSHHLKMDMQRSGVSCQRREKMMGTVKDKKGCGMKGEAAV